MPFELVAAVENCQKNRLWTRYIETRDASVYRKYKSVRNAVRNATRKLQKDEQKEVTMQCKKNPKIFWKYIDSKRQIYDHIGDLKTFDKDGNMRTACTDSDKAEALGNFFASVFNRESEFVEATAQPRPCQFSSQDPDISEQIILKKLNDLNVTKSPGPDNIHPRILYELRHELVLPLKILFETSYKLGQLPADWKTGNITAILKKGNKSDPSKIELQTNQSDQHCL